MRLIHQQQCEIFKVLVNVIEVWAMQIPEQNNCFLEKHSVSLFEIQKCNFCIFVNQKCTKVCAYTNERIGNAVLFK